MRETEDREDDRVSRVPALRTSIVDEHLEKQPRGHDTGEKSDVPRSSETTHPDEPAMQSIENRE